MWLNILLIAFLAGMAYYWGSVQGLFSGFLHLLATIAAGAIALALWEPVVLGFLMGRMPEYSWGVGLVGPFILLLLAIRAALDKAVPGNLHFAAWINAVVGGVFGLLAGIVAAGIVLIGVGMLPLPANFMGWEPLVIHANGRITANPDSSLWVNVDKLTASFYDTLSSGAMAPGFPVADGVNIEAYRDNLALEAKLHRSRYFDPNSSTVAVPQGLTVVGRFDRPLPWSQSSVALAQALDIADASQVQGKNLVVIDTHWEKTLGTFDDDGNLRIGSAQVRLIAWGSAQDSSRVYVYAPRGVGQLSAGDPRRTLVPFNNSSNFAALNDHGNLAWIFVVPQDQTPKFLLVRDLRLDLPPAQASTQDLAAVVGELPRPAQPPARVPGQGAVGPAAPGREGLPAEAIKLTDALPAPISANMATGLKIEGSAVYSGTSDVVYTTSLTPATSVDHVFCPPQKRVVRVRLQGDMAQSIFGKSIQAAALLQPIFLTDSQGERYEPIGYDWLQHNQTQRISIDRLRGIKAASELPVRQMQPGDEIYLYFLVPRGVTITAYNLGTSQQTVTLDTAR